MKKTKALTISHVVCFVGISGKSDDRGPIKPLSEETLSGKIISSVEAKLRTVSECPMFFRDNLVRNPPLCAGKLRYPTLREMKAEWALFERRLAKTKSNVVVLLGALVADFFRDRRRIRTFLCPSADGLLLKWVGVDENGLIILAVAHPSYVGVYARKRLGEYAEIILQAIKGLPINKGP